MQVGGFSPNHTRSAGGAGTRAAVPGAVPPHHTHGLPPTFERQASLAWPLPVSLLSLAPDPPTIIRSNRGPLVGHLGTGGTVGCSMPWVALLEGSSYVGNLGPQGPAPQPATSKPLNMVQHTSLHGGDPALRGRPAPWVRPHPGDLFQFPQGEGTRARRALQGLPSRK